MYQTNMCIMVRVFAAETYRVDQGVDQTKEELREDDDDDRFSFKIIVEINPAIAHSCHAFLGVLSLISVGFGIS